MADHPNHARIELRRNEISALVSAVHLSTLFLFVTSAPAIADEAGSAFKDRVVPILEQHCLGCHNTGAKKGGIAFNPDDPALLTDKALWNRVLRMVRADLMPPADMDRLVGEEISDLESWVKRHPFRIDPENVDPGRVILRRLNRVEYANTVRDLLGVEFQADKEFPTDDSGHGFDNIGEVLTLSPLLLEKYLAAAKTIVSKAVPTVGWVMAEQWIPGNRFRRDNDEPSSRRGGSLSLSYYTPASASLTHEVKTPGKYKVVLDLTAAETYIDGQFDYNKCRATFKINDQTLLAEEFVRQGNKPYRFEYDQEWPAGPRTFTIAVEPLTPNEKQVRSLNLRLNALIVQGPRSQEHYVRPQGYERFFPGTVPSEPEGQRTYRRERLREFATRAYRRPLNDATVDRLDALAETHSVQPGQCFESGMARAMTVILASPRFLFLEEFAVPNSPDKYPLIDEYSLASRLSYFLWSSMPDDALFRLAETNQLRAKLPEQVERMLADPKSEQFVRNFVGQWLLARNIDSIDVNAFAVLSKDEPPDPEAEARRERFRELRRKPAEQLTEAEKKELEEGRQLFQRSFGRFRQFELNGELRRAMRQETQMLFEHVLRDDRSLLELLDCNYAFLNERLARHYGIEGVTGNEMRKVELPKGSPRGGILTQGTVLVVTSNPDRTSPVKRGLFILDNVLGVPPPPPPANVPPLEDSVGRRRENALPLREALEKHRGDPLCHSCHNRMDPLGLAFENFNALGLWRDKERNKPIDAAGELVTGETFQGVAELKRILVNERQQDFYRCVTEKLLMYAVGRGLDYSDVEPVDRIVEKLVETNGRPSVLLKGIIESSAFQRRRPQEPAEASVERNQKSLTPQPGE